MTVWQWLPIGYGLSVALEMPVLLLGLSRRHSLRLKVFAGFWLTACTYPVVIVVIPALLGRFDDLICEGFAALAEMALFRSIAPDATVRDLAVVAVANLVSYGAGRLLFG